MPRSHTWSTTPKGGTSQDFAVDMPKGPEDEALTIKRFGSVERLYVCAARQRTVDVAPGLRVYLGRGDVAGAEKFAESFVDDGTRTAVEAIAITEDEADEQGFSEKNLAFLAAKGIQL
ncbi:MAG: hypothetical protein KAJ55_01455 [Anaerolineales bacterium]|nr:hypothetical protein [Anaerolineales bacterium]